MRVVALAGAAAAAVLLAGRAFADAAPPEMPPGSAIGAGSQTQVEMRSERVLIEVMTRTMTAEDFGIVSDAAWAQVSAQFFMRNSGQAGERMQVRFPLADPYGLGAFYEGYPEVVGFEVWVDGAPKSTTVITSANPLGESWPALRWAAWDTAFPAGQDVVISATYRISPTGYFPEARFAYVLSTGAGWKGSIGKADMIVRLPYKATSENVILEKGKTTPKSKLSGNEIRWQFVNLEPAQENDLIATILSPNIWQGIVDARAAVKQAPRDAQLWLALGEAYFRAIPMKYVPTGGEQYVKLSQQAMQKAVALAPKSAEAHVAYAELLLNLYRFEVEDHPQGATARKIIREAETALKLDPGNQKAQDILNEMGVAQG
jgi:hypothetical protein